jgi:hypothetical protein
MFWLFLFLPSYGYCTEKTEEIKKDLRFNIIVGNSFNSDGSFTDHLLTRGEFSYGVWFKPWFRLGAFLVPFWRDQNGGTTHAIEWGLDASILFLRKERWSLGLEFNAGALYSDKDFPRRDTNRFNFDGSVGMVYRHKIGENYSLDAGYRGSHFSSNGYNNARSKNPGINYNALLLGISYYFR